MSAIVCGKRSFFEDIESAASSPTSASPPVYKKFRCSSATSPVRFTYSPPVHLSPVDQLKALFPDMEVQLLEKALKEAGDDLDSAINSLNELHLGYAKGNAGSATEENPNMEKGATLTGGNAVPLEEPQFQNNLPVDGAEWVDLLVREMMTATSIDDARSRAGRVLESLEKSISTRAGAEVAEGFHKEQIEALLRDNAILKRAVAIQHERQKEYDERNQEVLQLKQLVAQYQEQLRTLEVNNYALTLHLRQAQQGNSIPGRFNPDVF
ncbi:UNVERIFIED_CONTAM: hypothetical protein Sradi_0603100 [Sesamum radiatum]|uniref:CUE domain-containing protein n=1 Tax=Sesamum radiatum TaxID=300843 RepID=A0AAW2VL20_SESRA